MRVNTGEYNVKIPRFERAAPLPNARKKALYCSMNTFLLTRQLGTACSVLENKD